MLGSFGQKTKSVYMGQIRSIHVLCELPGKFTDLSTVREGIWVGRVGQRSFFLCISIEARPRLALKLHHQSFNNSFSWSFLDARLPRFPPLPHLPLLQPPSSLLSPSGRRDSKCLAEPGTHWSIPRAKPGAEEREERQHPVAR